MGKLSILIPSLTCRTKRLNRLLFNLANSFEDKGLVEVLVFIDNKEKSIGEKLNRLVGESSGEYLCFLADDDDYSNDFIKTVQEVLQNNNPDILTFDIKCHINGKYDKPTIHSIRYNSWYQNNDGYFRHLGQQNIIKSSIAKQFLFENISSGEDERWANVVYNSGLLKTEIYIKDIHYNYYFDVGISMSHNRANDNNQDIDWEIKDLSHFKFIKFLELL